MADYGTSRQLPLMDDYYSNSLAGIKVPTNAVQQQGQGIVWDGRPTIANANNPAFQQGLVAGQQTTPTGWFGQGGYLQTGAQVANAASGLMGAYTGYKNLQLAEDKFDFEKSLAGVNLANQADLINEQRLNATNIGLSLAGNTMDSAARENTVNRTLAGNVQRTL